jgi:hypothetical protein
MNSRPKVGILILQETVEIMPMRSFGIGVLMMRVIVELTK